MELEGRHVPWKLSQQRVEAAQGVPSTSVKTLMSIQEALERAGVEFTNGDAPGGRLRHREQRAGARDDGRPDRRRRAVLSPT